MTIINWGKFKGQHIEALMIEEPWYASFVYKRAIAIHDTRLLEAFDDQIRRDKFDPKDVYIGFGKYRNWLVRMVVESDVNYAKWLLENNGIKTKYPEVYNEVVRLLS